LANHHRLDILFLVQKNPGITVDGITEGLDRNFKTISDHTRKLVHAGLLNKKYIGHAVAHTLSPYGKKFLSFIKTFK
jgi:predicted transcriptional regulator